MCSFENNAEPLCSWTHDDDADFKWVRARGDQFNGIDWYDISWNYYAPDRDHTTGKIKSHFFVK